MNWWASLSLSWMTFFGLTDASGPQYLFWSGIGADISEITLVTAAIVFWRNHTCHVSRCWRLGRHEHTQDGMVYKLCQKHHPEVENKLRADSVKGSGDTPE